MSNPRWHAAKTKPLASFGRFSGRQAVLAVALLFLFAFAKAAASPPQRHAGKPVGNAWSDPDNPVFQKFKGDRLDLWSFKKPVRPAVPAVRAASWPRNPIDAFILARQEAMRLGPSPEADRRTLIRRLSFDLLGLPPTPEEVQRFVQDPEPGAYARLVDRLLASRHYGERWGRHWLDVVRFADTEGFERDEFRPSAWRYRDYVTRSFNDDKPYSDFVREQLAGDELAGPPNDPRNPDRIIATGFLRLGPHDSTAALFREDQKVRDYLMSDLVSTTGSAFLGLTLACCQCHDHKYDPLLQADHFRLRAFFAGVKFRDDLVVDPPELRTEIERHNQAIQAKIETVKRQIKALIQLAAGKVQARRRALAVAALASRRDSLLSAGVMALFTQLDKLPIRDEEASPVFSRVDKARHAELARQVARLTSQKRPVALALAMTDAGPKAPPTRVFAQGDITRPLGEVPPGYLSAFDPNPAEITAPNHQTTGRRLALADWVASRDHPLTARVMVNRLWQHHFGQGIVATPNDFGFSGTPPTHADLLDWLAVEFMESGWSIKHMHRLMLLSATYRQTSTVDGRKRSIDPDNRTLWRQNMQRLEAETLRDAQLAVSGKLLPTGSGPPLWPEMPMELLQANPVIFESEKDMAGRLEAYYTSPADRTDVRTVYTIQKRSVLQPTLTVFDLPDHVISCGRRTVSTVAPQALALLNNGFSVRMARAFAERVAREAGRTPCHRVNRAFWLALGRQPRADERDLLLDMLDRHTELHARQKHVSPEQAALVDLCRVLFNLNEFIYVD
jgi:hypothetical protein